MRKCRRAGELLAGPAGPGLQAASAETGGELNITPAPLLGLAEPQAGPVPAVIGHGCGSVANSHHSPGLLEMVRTRSAPGPSEGCV